MSFSDAPFEKTSFNFKWWMLSHASLKKKHIFIYAFLISERHSLSHFSFDFWNMHIFSKLEILNLRKKETRKMEKRLIESENDKERDHQIVLAENVSFSDKPFNTLLFIFKWCTFSYASFIYILNDDFFHVLFKRH